MADTNDAEHAGLSPAERGAQLRSWVFCNPREVKRVAAQGRRYNMAAYDVQADREFVADMEADRQAAALAKVVAAS